MITLNTIVHELTKPVGEWAAHNFDVHAHAPVAGIAEEAGELIHALLKSLQGIRGTPEEHREKVVDALADMTVFLAHVRYKVMRGEPMSALPGITNSDLALLFRWVATLFDNPTLVNIELFCIVIDKVAKGLQVDMEATVARVWVEVGKRDWRAFPKNGLNE